MAFIETKIRFIKVLYTRETGVDICEFECLECHRTFIAPHNIQHKPFMHICLSSDIWEKKRNKGNKSLSEIVEPVGRTERDWVVIVKCQKCGKEYSTSYLRINDGEEHSCGCDYSEKLSQGVCRSVQEHREKKLPMSGSLFVQTPFEKIEDLPDARPKRALYRCLECGEEFVAQQGLENKKFMHRCKSLEICKFKEGEEIENTGYVLERLIGRTMPICWYFTVKCSECGKLFPTTLPLLRSTPPSSCGCDFSLKMRAFGKTRTPDLTGRRFGRLTAIHMIENEEPGVFWYCECNCGGHAVVKSAYLVHGETKSCGCLNAESLIKRNEKFLTDIQGKKFGRLTAVRAITDENEIKIPIRANRATVWECKCDCGNTMQVYRNDLVGGNTRSCGCLAHEYVLEMNARKAEKPKVDLTGRKFGKLTVKYYLKDKRDGCGPRKENGSFIWYCECECGGHAEYSSHTLLRGNALSCGCMQSAGEFVIADILRKHGIQYEQHYKDETCINPETGKKLIFDFYLPEFNVLLEYDGKQHYRYFDSENTWNTYENFIAINARDVIKNNWATQNEIPLIRIPYTSLQDINASYIEQLIEQATSTQQNIFVPLSPGTLDDRPIKF